MAAAAERAGFPADGICDDIALGRQAATSYGSGIGTQNQYSCCTLQWSMDENGNHTYYDYDDDNRAGSRLWKANDGAFDPLAGRLVRFGISGATTTLVPYSSHCARSSNPQHPLGFIAATSHPSTHAPFFGRRHIFCRLSEKGWNRRRVCGVIILANLPTLFSLTPGSSQEPGVFLYGVSRPSST